MSQSKKIPVQVDKNNIAYLDKENISYSRFINVFIKLAELKYININKIHNLSVMFQNGDYNEDEIKKMFRL